MSSNWVRQVSGSALPQRYPNSVLGPYVFQGAGLDTMVQGSEPFAHTPEGIPLYAVETIVGHRRRADGVREYRVKWEKRTTLSWVEAELVENLPLCIQYNELRYML